MGIGFPVALTAAPEVHLLVPGFTVDELPIELSNQNNLRFAPDGSLTSLGYDGKVWRLKDGDGDGLEDRAEPFWEKSTLSVPVGMAWSTRGLYVSSHGKVSRLEDTDGDGRADQETTVASGWPATDVGSGGVDATAVAIHPDGSVYFGLLVADYSNAYRLKRRKDLSIAERAWLEKRGVHSGGDPEELVSLYDPQSPRGTIQKLDPKTGRLTTVCTGIRVPYALAWNALGDLFNTDQEGETWMPDGNPVDELNHIIPGKHYGFPPPHPKWLPGFENQAPAVGFGPQHQSACGLVFNDPKPQMTVISGPVDLPLPASPAQGLFGPESWKGNAIVVGESRGRLWRVELVKGTDGYRGKPSLIARFGMLITDVAISPRGDLYISAHSGEPDWGTGPQGKGKLFRIRYSDPRAPQPLGVWAESATEVRVRFDRPVDSGILSSFSNAQRTIGFGEFVSAGDRFETLKPPYSVVRQQDAAPRGTLRILSAQLVETGTVLSLTTDPHPLPVSYALTIGGLRRIGDSSPGETIDLEYNLKSGSKPELFTDRSFSEQQVAQFPVWAPKLQASAGTQSRMVTFQDGDWENGREWFFGDKLGCAKCHRIRGEGAIVGPDLSNLMHRDPEIILRDIREPNATLHPDYVTHRAELINGEVLVGFLRSEGSGTVQLFDATGKDTVVVRTQIKRLYPTGESLMPSGLLADLNTNAVSDLMTFLIREPVVRSAAEVERVLKLGNRAGFDVSASPFRLVLVASKQDHGPGQHDYPAWQKKWQRLLSTLPNVQVQLAWEWPTQEQFNQANVVVMYFWNHDWSASRLAQLDAFQERGGGLALIHAAVIADTHPEQLAQRIGLAAQPGRVKYRHTPFQLKLTSKSVLTRGLPESLAFLDEPYWPMIGETNQVDVLATADVDSEPRPLVWTFERGPGRVFTSIPGHYTWTLDDPFWRLLVLRGIAWAGRRDVEYLTEMTTKETTVMK